MEWCVVGYGLYRRKKRDGNVDGTFKGVPTSLSFFMMRADASRLVTTPVADTRHAA